MGNHSNLRKSIKELMNDLGSNEAAIVLKTTENTVHLISYARVSLEGDAFAVYTQTSSEYDKLQNAILIASISNRQAVWNLIAKALT